MVQPSLTSSPYAAGVGGEQVESLKNEMPQAWATGIAARHDNMVERVNFMFDRFFVKRYG